MQPVVPTEAIADHEIVRRIRAGEYRYQAVLYHRYADRIYRQCRHLLHDAERARDLAQDVLIRIFTHLDQLQDGSALAAWIRSITYHQCLNYRKAAGRRRTQGLDQVPDLPQAAENDTLARKIHLELQLNRLQHCLTLLRADERRILRLYYHEERSIRDIAGRLQLSESAVKMRLKRGRDHLGVFFRGEGTTEGT